MDLLTFLGPAGQLLVLLLFVLPFLMLGIITPIKAETEEEFMQRCMADGGSEEECQLAWADSMPADEGTAGPAPPPPGPASVKGMREERARLAAEIRRKADLINMEGRDFTAEERANWDRLNNDFDSLDSRIQAAERAAKISTSMGRAATPAPVRAAVQLVNRGASAGDAPQAILLQFRGRSILLQPGSPEHTRHGDPYRQQFARYLQTGYRAGLQVSKDPKGGYLAPTTFVAELIKFLDDTVIMRELATVLPPLGSAVSLGVPTLETDPNDADWTAEIPASDITEDDAMELGKRELMPHLLTKLIKVGNKLLRVAVIDAESLVRGRMGYKFAVTEEKGYLTGTGNQQPLGVFVASDDGIPTSRDVECASQTTFTADELMDLFYSLKEQYQMKATWLVSRTFLKIARKLKSTDNQYIWQPGLSGGEPATLLDRPYRQSEYVPSTFTIGKYVAVVGDFKAGYWIADSLDMEIQRLDELGALRNQTLFLGRKETDGAPVLAEAFARLQLKAS